MQQIVTSISDIKQPTREVEEKSIIPEDNLMKTYQPNVTISQFYISVLRSNISKENGLEFNKLFTFPESYVLDFDLFDDKLKNVFNMMLGDKENITAFLNETKFNYLYIKKNNNNPHKAIVYLYSSQELFSGNPHSAIIKLIVTKNKFNSADTQVYLYESGINKSTGKIERAGAVYYDQYTIGNNKVLGLYSIKDDNAQQIIQETNIFKETSKENYAVIQKKYKDSDKPMTVSPCYETSKYSWNSSVGTCWNKITGDEAFVINPYRQLYSLNEVTLKGDLRRVRDRNAGYRLFYLKVDGKDKDGTNYFIEYNGAGNTEVIKAIKIDGYEEYFTINQDLTEFVSLIEDMKDGVTTNKTIQSLCGYLPKDTSKPYEIADVDSTFEELASWYDSISSNE